MQIQTVAGPLAMADVPLSAEQRTRLVQSFSTALSESASVPRTSNPPGPARTGADLADQIEASFPQQIAAQNAVIDDAKSYLSDKQLDVLRKALTLRMDSMREAAVRMRAVPSTFRAAGSGIDGC
jgi:hypothetical protein